MADLTAVKDRIDAIVAEHAETLLAASHRIHEHPELGFEEHQARDVLSEVLAQWIERQLHSRHADLLQLREQFIGRSRLQRPTANGEAWSERIHEDQN